MGVVGKVWEEQLVPHLVPPNWFPHGDSTGGRLTEQSSIVEAAQSSEDVVLGSSECCPSCCHSSTSRLFDPCKASDWAPGLILDTNTVISALHCNLLQLQTDIEMHGSSGWVR